jgi:aryl-alcohol dehydrogenase-like predicted oxidoreductase
MTRPPALALGTAQFGLAYGVAGAQRPVHPDEVRRILELAAERGVRRLDTAPVYGDIEARLGDLIAGLPFSVVSKIPAARSECRPAQQLTFIKEAVELSKARLGDALVGILFHDPQALSGPDAEDRISVVLSECRDAQVAVGLSGYDPAITGKTVAAFSLSMAQVPGNVLDQRFAKAHKSFGNAEVTVRSIFLQGLLLMDREVAAAKVPAARPILKRWHEWVARRALTPMQAATAIVRNFPCEYCVVGVDNRDQLMTILDAWNTPPMDASEMASEALEIIDPRRWTH